MIVESYSTYYEKFSLNPRDWFMSTEEKAKLKQQEAEMKERARKNAVKYIPMLKTTLRDKGYTIHKHGYAYTVRGSRKVGLSTDDARVGDKSFQNELTLPYIKVLFTLAHEVGHTLQWSDDDTKENFEDFFKAQKEAEKIDPYKRLELESLHKLWYELDAWVKGMQFIPNELRQKYKQYAYHSYTSYMKKIPQYHKGDILLRNLLYKLNFEEQL